MTRIRRVVIGISALVLTGCAYSLNPLYTDADLVFEPVLIGEWHGDDRFYGSESHSDSSATYTFENTEKRGLYKLTYVDRKGVIRTFDAHLIRLRERRFLDVKRSDEPPANDLLLPVHALFRIEVSPSVLLVRMLDHAKTVALLRDKPDAIRHAYAQEDRLILLTADTMRLQTFLTAHEPQLFDDRPYAALSKELASKLSAELAWAGVGTAVHPDGCMPPIPSNKACPPEGHPWTHEVMDRLPANALSRRQFLTVAFWLKGPPAGTPMDLHSSWSFRPVLRDDALSSRRSGFSLPIECTVGEPCYAMTGEIHGSVGVGVMHVEISWRGQTLLEKDFDLYEPDQGRK